MHSIPLELPWPPSVNSYWRSIGRGRNILSADARDFHARARVAIYAQVVKMKPRPKIIKWPVALEIVMHPPDKRLRDLDNILKGLLDALTHAKVWEDDHWMHRLCLQWGEARKGGLARILITDL